MESDFTKMLQNSADFFPIINIPRYFLLSKNCSTWKDIFESFYWPCSNKIDSTSFTFIPDTKLVY